MADLSKIIELIEEKIAEAQREAHKIGFCVGYDKGSDAGYDTGYKVAKPEGQYQQGLNDAWECARKIAWEMARGNSSIRNDLIELFLTDDLEYIVKNFTASEAIAKIKEYEEKQTEKSCYTCDNFIDDFGCAYECDKNMSEWTPKQTENDCEYREICLTDGTLACRKCQNKSNFRQKPYTDYVPYHSKVKVEFDEDSRSYTYIMEDE